MKQKIDGKPPQASTRMRLPLPNLRKLCLLGTFAAVMAFACAGRAQVVINEVMADNDSAVYHFGVYPDYIELYNPTGDTVDLGGWSLSDDVALPQKYVLPVGTMIPSQQYLVVWADSEFGLPGLHTGFGLGASGDRVGLYSPGLALVDEVVFGLQITDFSIGRVPNATGTWALNLPSANLANTAAPLGTTSSLRFNEWMARPTSGDDWIELYNLAALPVSLGGLVITDGTPVNRAIPALSFIAPSGFSLFWADDLAKTDADHLDFKISADGETLRLYAANRTTILEQVTFGSQSVGISQGRAPNGSDTIVFFAAGMSTPGASNFRAITSVIISEVLSHTDPPLEDAIELQNISAAPVDISHWWLSDSTSNPRKFRIPAGTILDGGDFKVFYATQFSAGASGFALNSAEGDDVVLSTGDAAGNLTGSQTGVSFGALKRSVSVGRFTTSAGVDFIPLAAHTFGVNDPASLPEFRLGTGAANAGPRKSPLVINEIMHSPAGLNDEFLELHNTTAAPFPLYDPEATTNRWQLAEGVTFTFPPGTTLSAGGYLLVVAFDPVINPVRLSSFRAQYNVPAAVPVFGPYVGALNGAGEGVTLLEPDTPEGAGSPIPGFVPYMQSERVRYSPSAPWPSGAVDTGFSLQRLDPLAYCNEPLNWTAAAPTAGRVNKPDADNDGMPDAWENLHGFDRLSAADAALDADLDGMSNLNEYLTGTHPRDAASVLAIKTLKLEPGLVRIQFHAVQNRVYSLQALDALGSGSWTTLTTLPAATATGVMEFTHPVSPSATRYFRMSTVAVP